MKPTQQPKHHHETDLSLTREACSACYHSSIYAFTTPSDRLCDLGPYKSLAEAVQMTGIPAETWIATHPVKVKRPAARRDANHQPKVRKVKVNIFEQLLA